MAQVLITQTAIRRAIRDVMDPDLKRRVAIVAFVGKDPAAFIGNPRGAEVVCWPRAGGTHPDGVRALRERHARVFFADRLHMKLYWSSKRAVIGSANLSSNALGAGDLREMAVRLPSTSIDIDEILRTVKPREVDDTALDKLARAHKVFARKHGHRGGGSVAVDFATWYSTPRRRAFRLTWYEGEGTAGRRAKEESERLGGDGDVANFVDCRRGDLQAEEWVLVGRRTAEQFLTALEWLYVQTVVKVGKSERKAYSASYPHQAVQVHALRMCPQPPFKIDGAFRRALRAWRDEIGGDEFERRVLTDTAAKVTPAIASGVHRHLGGR